MDSECNLLTYFRILLYICRILSIVILQFEVNCVGDNNFKYFNVSPERIIMVCFPQQLVLLFSSKYLCCSKLFSVHP